MTTNADTIHILHVDDDPSLSDMVATFLEREDNRIEVQTTTNPDDGLEILTNHDVDCIVSDYDMPRQDGIEFLETVREEYQDLPFILYTGKGSEEVAADAISAGVSDYLQKESRSDQYTVLANRIINLVSQSRAETRVEQYAEAEAESERYRQQLLELISDPSRSDDEKIDRLLALGCERLGVENGHLVMIDEVAGKHDVISVHGSDVVREGVTDLSTTYCRKTIESDDILDVNHAGDHGWDGDPAYEAFKLECYIGGKLTADDTLFGTLCFVDSEPREPFTHNEKAFFNLLLQWFNQMVERRRRLNQAEAVFEHAQDAIFLIDVINEETFRIRSVNRAYEEMTGLSTARLREKTPRELLGDEQGGEVEARFKECVTERTPIQYEEQLTVDDQTFDFQTRLAPIIEEDTVVQLVGATRDITERKQREQRYNAVFNQTYQFTGLLEPDGTLIEANKTALEFGGLEREDVIGEKIWETEWFQHSDETEERARQAVERAANGEFVRYELPVQGADREAIIDFSVRPITDDNGNVTLLVPEGRDITERKEREQELREEQAFIEQSLDTLDDIFYFVDTDGDFQRWNSTLPELTGYSDEEIGSMNALEFFEGDHREAIEHSIHEILETGSHVTEAEITTADGRQVPHEFRGVRMTNDEGEPTGIIGIARDITERKEHERQLEEKTEELEQLATKFETQYRTLFEEAPVMTILTREEDGEPIIEDCNSQFVETLGYDEDVIIDSELAEFYTPDSAERLLEEGGYRRSLEGEFDRERRDLVTADGETVETLLRAVPRRTADGEIIGTVAMYIDITERESVKRANERLEEFTSVVSHDLRNPLSVATGRLELVAEECDSDHLDDLEQALDRMGTLIDDLLTLAREGREVTDAQVIDLATMINGCWENVDTNEAVLITNIDRGVRADRSRLKQVFENLFRNAVEHGGADVTVTVGELDDGFYIEDDGPGIPSDERDEIFEAGYSRSADGTGFGLSIVEQIVDAHDWQIRVTDGADGGARFEITDVELVAA